MSRREFIALLGSVVVSPLTAPTARAQQSRAKIPRLCFLTFDPGTRTRLEPFFQGLRDLGYVDGQSIAIDHLSADSQGDRFPALLVLGRGAAVNAAGTLTVLRDMSRLAIIAAFLVVTLPSVAVRGQETAELQRDRAAVIAKRATQKCLRGSKRMCKPK